MSAILYGRPLSPRPRQPFSQLFVVDGDSVAAVVLGSQWLVADDPSKLRERFERGELNELRSYDLVSSQHRSFVHLHFFPIAPHSLPQGDLEAGASGRARLECMAMVRHAPPGHSAWWTVDAAELIRRRDEEGGMSYHAGDKITHCYRAYEPAFKKYQDLLPSFCADVGSSGVFTDPPMMMEQASVQDPPDFWRTAKLVMKNRLTQLKKEEEEIRKRPTTEMSNEEFANIMRKRRVARG